MLEQTIFIEKILFKELETKKRKLEETVDGLNEEVGTLKAAEQVTKNGLFTVVR